MLQGCLSEQRLDAVPWFPGCPGRLQGDFLARLHQLPEPWVGAATGAQFPAFLPGGMSSLALFPAGECGGAAAVSQPCSRRVRVAACLHRLLFPLPSLWFFIVLTPNQQFYFHFPTPDFSAEKYPFCCLAGKQKLGLCREDGDGGQLQTPLLAPPPLNSDSFHQHVFIVLQADE